MAVHLFAAIDVGSFELEMGIYETTSRNELREIDHLRHVISLGRDTYHTGKISYHLVDEMCQVLEEFAQVMKTYQVEDYRAYATSAMREAKNSQIILEQIRVRTGIQVGDQQLRAAFFRLQGHRHEGDRVPEDHPEGNRYCGCQFWKSSDLSV